MSILDIWSSDEEERGLVDLWKDGKGTRARPVEKVEKKEEGAKPEGLEKERIESRKEEKKNEEVIKAKMTKLLPVFRSC